MTQLAARAQELIRQLDLLPHPEGGYFKETYRSETMLDGTERQLMTSIFFLVTGTDVSRFHRISSDECWYFHEGNTLAVHTLDKAGHHTFHLGTDLEKGELPFYLVKGKTIFGSCLSGEEGYALVSCAVAPGFDFRDFELFGYDELIGDFPEHEGIVRKLT